ncbi:hypothetical protein D2A91_12360 [Enterococcus faecalis]|nr:hypothetical protein [Enterococcus faecalis]TQB29372.1 hypothetical protein FKZ00_10275 [Enterococcus faecalis]
MAIKRQSKIIRLRHRLFKKDNFCKGKRIICEVKDKNHFRFLSFSFYNSFLEIVVNTVKVKKMNISIDSFNILKVLLILARKIIHL